MEKYGFWNGWEVLKEGLSGGLLQRWMTNQSFNIQYSSKYLIHADLLDNKGNPLSISFVYWHHNHAKGVEVWVELRNIMNLVHKNWLCIGDFNQVLSHDDKFGFSHMKIEGVEIFKQTLFDLGLCDLEAKGQKYTRMNGHGDKNLLWIGWIEPCHYRSNQFKSSLCT